MLGEFCNHHGITLLVVHVVSDVLSRQVLVVGYSDDSELQALRSRLATDEVLRRVTVIAVELSRCVSSRELPDKLLFNVGIDSARTDHLMISPLHVVLGRAGSGSTGIGVSVGGVLDELRVRGASLRRDYGLAMVVPLAVDSSVSASRCKNREGDASTVSVGS
jgi:hypothetical protein